jgi:hypothetical protein
VGSRNIVLVVDGSLSMFGDKLDRAVELVDQLVRRFQPTDQVTLLFANTQGIVTPGSRNRRRNMAGPGGRLSARAKSGRRPGLVATLEQAGR